MNENDTLRDLPEDSGQVSQRTITENLLQQNSVEAPAEEERTLASLDGDPRTIAEANLQSAPATEQSLNTVAERHDVPVLRPAKKLYVQGSRSRFRVLRPHAKGGLGKVSVAIDQELNREVALKEILSQYCDDTFARERFLLEAEITGGLEHPGIVPVYGLGQGDDGSPYYAMRFIKGDSLKQAIEDFHRPDAPNRKDPGARHLALRQLLDRFIDVCNAMEYAHSRGILHRDLKPANIMVGKFGETLVVDWGLAKAIGAREIGADEPLRPLSVLSGSVQTLQGSAVGTPAYMSPEQAAGKLDELSPATDIYSLGATLYHILCGRPPFEKQSVNEMLIKVQRGEFASPRQRNPEVARGLEAICLKGMARLPEDRYPTARALADDIAHWLADEPVSAATETISEKIARWARKHKGLVQAGSVSVILVALVSSIAYGIVSVANHRLDSANLRIVEQNKQLNVARNAAEESATAARLSEQEALQQRTIAQEQRDNAIRQEQRARELVLEASRSDFATAQARLLEEKPREALAYLGRALRYDSGNADARDALWMTLKYRPQVFSSLPRNRFLHQDAVLGASFSPDGKRLITVSRDQTARIWDAENGQPIGMTLQHEAAVNSAEFSPDGQLVITVSDDRQVRIWDANSGTPTAAPMVHGDQVYVAVFSPDGKRFVTASGDGTAQVWDTQSQSPAGAAMKHQDGVFYANFSPNGTQVVTASGDTTAQVWDAMSGQPIGAPLRHQGAVYMARFSPDGRSVITTSGDTTARVWDVASGQPLFPPLNHDRSVSSGRFSPDGSRVVTASDDKTARIWDSRTGDPIGIPLKHEGPVVSASFSVDGLRIVTSSDDHTVRVWDAMTGLPIGTPISHGDAVNSCMFSPDGTVVLSASDDQTAAVWNGRWGTPPDPQFRQGDSVYSAAFSRDGSRIVTASGDGSAVIWNRQTGQTIGQPLKHGRSITVARFSADSKRIVTASDDSTARIWNAHTGDPVTPPMVHAGVVVDANFSPDGRRLVTASHDGTSRIWDAEMGNPVGATLKHNGFVESSRFSPDGKFVVTASRDKTAMIWNAESGIPFGTPLQHEDAVYRAEFSPDGHNVLTASRDKTARVWDAKTGMQLGSPLLHDDSVSIAIYDPGGKRILTVCEDRVVRIWDFETREIVAKSEVHEGRINQAVFSPLGMRFLTSNEDRTARLWNSATGQPIGAPLLQPGSLNSADFSPDGTQVVTASDAKTAQLWDVRSVQEVDGSTAELLTGLVSGVQLGRRSGVLEPVSVEDRLRARESLKSLLDSGSDWSILFNMLVHPQAESQTSPHSTVTFRRAVTSLIQSDSPVQLLQALTLDPGHPLIPIGFAGIKEYSVQAAFLREYAIQRLPAEPMICRDAARMLLRQDDIAGAVGAIEKALEAESDHAETMPIVAQILAKADAKSGDDLIRQSADRLRRRLAEKK